MIASNTTVSAPLCGLSRPPLRDCAVICYLGNGAEVTTIRSCRLAPSRTQVIVCAQRSRASQITPRAHQFGDLPDMSQIV